MNTTPTRPFGIAFPTWSLLASTTLFVGMPALALLAASLSRPLGAGFIEGAALLLVALATTTKTRNEMLRDGASVAASPSIAPALRLEAERKALVWGLTATAVWLTFFAHILE